MATDVRKLVEQMTLEEKVSQMIHPAAGIDFPSSPPDTQP